MWVAKSKSDAYIYLSSPKKVKIMTTPPRPASLASRCATALALPSRSFNPLRVAPPSTLSCSVPPYLVETIQTIVPIIIAQSCILRWASNRTPLFKKKLSTLNTLSRSTTTNMKFSTAFVLLSGAPAALGFQSVGKTNL